MGKITIIDGNSLLFRAYYATAYPGVEIMRNKNGVPTNAIFAFSNMLNKILSNIKDGEGLFVAFDAGKHNFRHDQLETYKANRKPAPQELVEQFPIVRDFLKAMNIFQFEIADFEGDDVAGTVAKLAAKEGNEVHIYTSDRDFLQLVDNSITVQIIKKGLSDVVAMTPTLVKETYGFEPLQIIDYKGLRGDSSDNLPGIPGIGEKTAVKLIEEYGSFDNIIANVDNIKGKVGENIKANIELGKTSRDLAIIKTDVPLPFTIDDIKYQGYDFKSLNEFCQKYELKQFISKVAPKWKKVNESQIKIEATIVDSFKNIELGDEIGLYLDLAEEDDYYRSDIYGFAVSNKNHSYYISFENAIKDEKFINILKDKNVKKSCFDYKSIKVCLSKENIEINGLDFDLLIASYLIDSSIKSNPVSVLNLFDIDISEEDNEAVSLFGASRPDYTASISRYALSLKNKALEELDKNNTLNLYNTLELPLVETLSNMEIEGFPLHAPILDSFGDEYKKKLNELSEEIYLLAGEKFNIASPKQLGEILYVKLGLPSNKKMSTSIEALKELENKHPIINKIMEYRKYFKLVTTYIEGLKPHIFPDGKIHATFNQALTQTGRLSSSNPNLQNISVRDEDGKNIRKAFYYDDDNYEILSLDYSQIELRVLGHLAKSDNLRTIFESDEDIHSATAKRVFRLEGEPTSLQRRKAKAVNFGIIYGISDWGLADQLEISVKEAKNIIDNFYYSFPEIATFFRNIVSNALNDGYVSTMFGRRRYLRELHDSSYQVREFAKRAAMNAPIQGTAADLIKIAMIQVEKMLEEKGYKTKMVLQIHDELIFKVPLAEKEAVYKDIKNVMEHAIDLSVPLKVDGGFGKDWYSAK